MLIYRIENNDGRGIYRCYEIADHIINQSYKHPSPHQDIILGNVWNDLCTQNKHIHYYFGFNSIKQLLEWFDIETIKEINRIVFHLLRNSPELKYLYDFHIAIYEVDDKYVFVGDRQTIFKKRYAIKKDALTFDEFLCITDKQID